MLKSIFIFSLIFFMTISCNHSKPQEKVYLYPADKTQVISIFSDYKKNKRVIALGKHEYLPKDNYIKLDISLVLELGNDMGVCWEKNGYKWEIAMPKAKILESKLDSTLYKFNTSFDTNKYGVPNVKRYVKNNCYHYAFDLNQITPSENGIFINE